MAAVASEKMAEPLISPSESVDGSSSARLSDVVASYDLSTVDMPDRPSLVDPSSSPSRQSDDQVQNYLLPFEFNFLNFFFYFKLNDEC